MRLCSIVICSILLAVSGQCSAQTLNSKVTTYLASKVGKRCGGGECAHAVSEALRAAGAEFAPPDLGSDQPAAGDYVWGNLVKSISNLNGKAWSDSKPTAKIMAGDVIQYRNTTFVYSNTTARSTQHTSVVASVNSAGFPTAVYEQNFNRIRSVRKNQIDLKKLTTGYVQIYRPKTRKNRLGQFKFTVTNKTNLPLAASLRLGNVAIGSLNLAANNTIASYQTGWVTLTGTPAAITLRIPNGSDVTIAQAGAYEIFTTTSGNSIIRRTVE